MVDPVVGVVKGKTPGITPRTAPAWIGIVVGPLAALLAQLFGFAGVPLACDAGVRLALHLPFVGGAIVSLVGTFVSFELWREARRERDALNGPATRREFLGLLGFAISALATLVIVAMWAATLFLDPCFTR